MLRKLFKGGNYSKTETIRGNMVFYLPASAILFIAATWRTRLSWTKVLNRSGSLANTYDKSRDTIRGHSTTMWTGFWYFWSPLSCVDSFHTLKYSRKKLRIGRVKNISFFESDIGRNFDDYPGFQLKTTPAQRYATQQCRRAEGYR